jgi:hypothetical protein
MYRENIFADLKAHQVSFPLSVSMQMERERRLRPRNTPSVDLNDAKA